MAETQLAELQTWLTEPLTLAVAESVSRLRAAEGVKKVCLMPDVHLASEVCVGVVVATEGVLYPQTVGGDIGCGMAALRFDIEAEALNNEQAACAVLAGLYKSVPSNKHRQAVPLPEGLRPAELSDPRLAKLATRDGAVQLGTLGRGNHFLELQADEGGQLWVMLHSGSRAMGQAITARHLSNGEPNRAGLRGLDADTDFGAAYLHDMAWARKYAAENRLAMLRAVEELVSRLFRVEADWHSLIHANHNHVQRETHGGQSYFVHRKGAQLATEGEAGVVPGSMGAASFHTAGRGCEAALASCSHGAGRRMSRTEARQAITTKSFQRQVGGLWYDHRRVDSLRDESPGAYKNIRDVMRAQRELVKIVRELRPVLSYKGV
jgi:tRNA-splicing ligase RtcB